VFSTDATVFAWRELADRSSALRAKIQTENHESSGADTISAVITKCPREAAPRGLGRRTKEATIMTTTKLIALVLLCLVTGTATAQQAKVTPLMSKDLTDNPGREVLMITVEHAPGGSSPIHRHNAQAIVYVLEGSVVMQVKGGKPVTLTPGQTFYEGPDDVHVVDRNASSTEPAKYLVFLIKNKGAPVLLPAE
jgi:quercetin dioxygenase-like cupin family protein